MMPRVLVTGAQGFMGAQVVAGAVARGWHVNASARRAWTAPATGVERCHIGELDGPGWESVLADRDAVVHCAGRAHKLHDKASPSVALAAFRAVNVEGTLVLARQAAAAGVRRFVFISSIGVNGNFTSPGTAFTEDDQPRPVTPYGVSKREAEQGLLQLGQETGMEIVIIRPPLVYGAAAPGNFGALIKLIRRGWPLPFGAIHNARSLVGVGNLVDFVLLCVRHPHAADQTFVISDGADISTTQLLQAMAASVGVKSRLLPVPAGLLRLAGRLIGRREAMQGLCGNLQVDISKARERLGWKPVFSLDAGLKNLLERKHNL